MHSESSYLPAGLPVPVAEPDGLSAPYWGGLQQGRLLVQRCASCGCWQFGPEWICHRCHAFDPEWTEVAPRGECTLVVAGADPAARITTVDVEAELRALLASGLGPRDAAARLVVRTGKPRRQLYQLALSLARTDGAGSAALGGEDGGDGELDRPDPDRSGRR